MSAADNVIDLIEWRASRRPDPLPDDLISELDAASRVYDALLAQGHELRFDLPDDGSHVRVELRAIDGGLVRPVALSEVLGLDESSPPGAA